MKRRDEVLVGIFLTVAAAIALLGTLWLVRGGLSSGYPLYSRFAWGQNLKPGQQVLLAGVAVGTVADVTLRNDGYLDVVLRVNDDVKVPKNSVASVKPVGIFGDAAIALTPKGPSPVSFSAGDTVPVGPADGRLAATTAAQAPVPQDWVSPTPRSKTRIASESDPWRTTNSTLTPSGKSSAR